MRALWWVRPTKSPGRCAQAISQPVSCGVVATDDPCPRWWTKGLTVPGYGVTRTTIQKWTGQAGQWPKED